MSKAKAPTVSTQHQSDSQVPTKAKERNKPSPDANGGKSENVVSGKKVPVKGKVQAKKTAPKRVAAKKQPTKKVELAKPIGRGKKIAQTVKSELFVKHYVANGGNASKAALAAGYSETTAHTSGWELLQKPEIKAAIKAEVAAALEDIDITRAAWLQEVKRLAFSNIKQVAEFDAEGLNFKPSSELTDDQSATIESVEFVEISGENAYRKNLKIKQHSKSESLKILGKFLGMLIDKTEIEHSGAVDMTQLTPEEFAKKKAEFLAKNAKKIENK